MKLKSVIGSLLAAATLGVFSVNASAATLAQVGEYDDLIAQTSGINSGPEEEAFVLANTPAGTTYAQLNNSGFEAWEVVTDGLTGDVAFLFPDGATPDFFLVKIGGGGGAGGDDTHYLFQNDPSLLWAFINLSVFGEGVDLENLEIISHVGITGGTTTVSEPGILALFGVGVLLLGFMRRRAIA